MKKQFTFFALLLACSLFTSAQNKIKLVQFSTGYSSPVGIENAGDSRLFVVEEEGKIIICDSNGKRTSKPFLDITDRVLFNGEQGLLGLAFDPDYASNGFFYLNYINKSGNTQISRFRVKSGDPNQALKTSETYILKIDQPYSNHNGGCTHFGPDGYLYIGMGDGGNGGDPQNNSQNHNSLLGKMLRIDVHNGLPYKIPADNPFVDSTGYKKEIWALGLRNPWRWSFDAESGAMYIGDVGQASWEEVDVEFNGAKKGGHNYGWRCFEGKHVYNDSGCLAQSAYNLPRYEYPHSDSTGDCSITGGFVYRGTRYASLYGKYIFTDYCSGLFRLLYTEGGKARVRIALDGDNGAYSSFGEDRNNELYVCSLADGNIYHITDGSTSLQNNYSSNNKDINRFSFSPNPSRGSINVSYTSDKAMQIIVRITGILGQQVYAASRAVNAGINTWNINLNIPTGSYYLSVINNTGNITTQSLRVQ